MRLLRANASINSMHDNRTGKGRCHERSGDGSGRSTHESPVNESMEINLFPIGNEPILLLHIIFTNNGFSIASIAMAKPAILNMDMF